MCILESKLYDILDFCELIDWLIVWSIKFEYTVKLGYSNIGFCDTLSIASNIQWHALISHKAYSFITTLFLGPFDDVITKFYCTYKWVITVLYQLVLLFFW
jgi:hypothetical protein